MTCETIQRSCSLPTRRLHRPLILARSGCVTTISTSLLSGLPLRYLRIHIHKRRQ